MTRTASGEDLDEVAWRLLDALQADGRAPLKSLAESTGLSVAATAERLKRLQEAGLVRAITADVDTSKAGYSVKAIVGNLELSGLCGLDFILDDDGRAHLLELNPRATPTAHLVAADGTDLLTALRAAFGHEQPAARTATYATGLVALFPQELCRDPSSPYLGLAHHDVPTHAPDFVDQVLADLGGKARTHSTTIPTAAALEADIR